MKDSRLLLFRNAPCQNKNVTC